MKKAVLCFLVFAMLFSLAACKGNGDEVSEDVSKSDYGLGDIAEGAGLSRDVIFSALSDDDKAKLEKHAASLGIEVSYGDDGSTMFVYTADAAQKRTITQTKDGVVSLTEGEGGTAKLNDKWPENDLTALLPVPSFEVVSESNINGKFVVQFGVVTPEDMSSYAREVKAAGFNVDVSETNEDGMYSFVAYNSDGVKVELDSVGIGSVKITPAAD